MPDYDDYDYEDVMGIDFDEGDPYDDDLDWEDDGQPSEYDEWQDVYGGDDWDHGQFDDADDFY